MTDFNFFKFNALFLSAIKPDPGESRRIQENPGESRRIQENPGESRRILTVPSLVGCSGEEGGGGGGGGKQKIPKESLKKCSNESH